MALETARPGESKRRNTDAVDIPSPRAWKRRKHGPAAAVAADLPDDIISEILRLLPARSIIRFRAVCRSWDARLSSPSFAEAYAAKAAARRMTNYKFVFFAPSPNRSTTAYSCTRRTVAVDRLFTVDRLRTDFLCLSSKPCHGLLLFSDAGSKRYWVCNPSTGECRRLPQQHRGLTGSSAGLVYDHRTKERKVVHLFFKERTTDPCIQCEVYTLEVQDPASRQWRPANGDVESLTGRAVKALEIEDLVTKVPPVLAAGCLHWLVYPNRGDDVSLQPGQDAILCFSVTAANLRLLNAPASVLHALHQDRRLDGDSSAVPIHLAELQGSLCVVHDLRRRGSETTSSIDLWMLRDHDAGEWSLDHRIAVTPILARGVHSPRFITVLSCCGGKGGTGTDRMKILIATSQHKIHAYDPDTGHIDLVLSVPETDIGSQQESAAAVWFGLYEDSLVRIGGQSFRQKQVLSGLTEILLRLPIKSIAKSMLVCREWCSLIESESFVSKHTSSSKSLKKIFMVTNGLDGSGFFDFASVGSWLQAGPAHVSRRIICSKPCNGLNLISTSRDDYLCNPCTGAIRCLGIRGKSPRFNPGCCTDQQRPSRRRRRRRRRHAFSVGRNVGFGLDRSTGDHVAVEIGRIDGVLACMVKTSSAEAWTACAGKPPVPVSDMPPAHVDGTLYWMSVRTRQQERVVVAFDISSRSFNIVPCEPCLNNVDRDAFLVELDGTLCLVVTNAEADEMEIWAMHRDGSWVDAYMIRLNEHPDYSVKTGQAPVVVPVDVSSKDGSILLNTGRALGYYDYKTGVIHNPYYSLDQLKLPRSSLASPILCQESIARIQDDQLPTRVVPPFSLEEESSGRRDHPQNDGGATPDGCGPSRSVLQECEDGACRNVGVVYRSCCRRVVCVSCGRRCLEHSRLLYLDYDLPASFSDMDMQIEDSALFLVHPCVPGTDYWYYYSTERGNVVRHVFISLKDYIQSSQSWHLIECGYRIEGKVIKDTWVQRCLQL